VSGAGVHAAAATPAADDNSNGLEEITVIARKRSEDLQEVPISIAVISGDQVEARGIDNQIELTHMVPGLVIHGSNGFFGLQEGGFGIRGTQNVTIYYDGIAHPETFGVPQGDILELDHMEVLRGPQGTLFGKDTMSGAIQYVTKLPSDVYGARVKLTTGSYNRMDATAYVDLPLTDTLLTKLTLAKLSKGGYVQSVSNNEMYGSEDDIMADYDVLWKPIEKFSLRLDVSYVYDRNDGEPGTDWAINTSSNCHNTTPKGNANPDLTCLYNALIGPNGKQLFPIPQTWAYGASQQYKTAINYVGPDPWTLIRGFATTAKYDISDRWQTKFLGGYREVENFDYENFSGTAYNLFTGKNYNEQDEENLEYQLNFNGSRLTGTDGVYYYEDNRRADRQNWLQNELVSTINPVANAAAIAYLTANGFGHQTSTTNGPVLSNNNVNQLVYNYSHGWALFTEWNYKITDALSATAGVRYNEDKVSVRTLVPAFPLPLVCCEPASSTATTGAVVGIPQFLQFHNTAPKVSTQYQWTPDFMTYALYSQGFDRGGATTTNPPGGGAPLIIAYQPEKLYNYEVGARTEWFNHRLISNLTVFYQQYKDIQVGVDQNNINVTRNGGQAFSKGIEFEGQWEVVDGLYVNYSYEYDNARVSSLLPGTTAKITVGQVLAYAPEKSYALGGAYDIKLPGGAKITPRVDYGWNSDVYTTNDYTNRAAIPAFGLMNGRITYYPPDKKWDAEIAGTNLTDKYYRYNGYIVPGTGVDTGAPGRPREWALTFHFKFQ
jgi:iron complex outermembrane receptor protein